MGDGQRTIDEMGFAWIGWFDLTDDEYKARVARRGKTQERRARRSSSNSSSNVGETYGAELLSSPRRFFRIQCHYISSFCIGRLLMSFQSIGGSWLHGSSSCSSLRRRRRAQVEIDNNFKYNSGQDVAAGVRRAGRIRRRQRSTCTSAI